MSLSVDAKTCGICHVRTATGQGKAIFTAECSHSFHFSCITNYARHGNDLCPVCHVKWNDLPFPTSFNSSANNRSYGFSTYTTPRYSSFQYPMFEAEPNNFNYDEPLAAPTTAYDAIPSVRLSIRAIPERPAVLASESISEFSVLVGLKARLLSDDISDFHRAPVDLVTVLDVSGSMSGSKLDLVKRAVLFVIDNLGSSDRLSIVSFSNDARVVLQLTRMTESGRQSGVRAVNRLYASGGTNIVEGLKKGARVLEERREKNPVSSIMFLSDGNDSCHRNLLGSSRKAPQYLDLLPASISPRNRPASDDLDQHTVPVHAFGFGSDHDPLAMHAISSSSGGTFSFIESFEMVQDAFAKCIGGLLSVVIQELRLTVYTASPGVIIKSIPSGRYVSEIHNNGSEGIINVGDMYAEEDREFLVNLSVPKLYNRGNEENEKITLLLNVTCSYKYVVSEEILKLDAAPVEIRRPTFLSPMDSDINIEVDRQRNRISVAASLAEAQRKAESGDLVGARAVLSHRRLALNSSASREAGDDLCTSLEEERKETEERMSSMESYKRTGRAYTLAGISSHATQRANTRGSSRVSNPSSVSALPDDYSTPFMQYMVGRSRQRSKMTDGSNFSVGALN